MVLFFLPCVEDAGTGRHLWLREARGHPEGRQPERPGTVEGAVQGRGEQEWGRSPSGGGAQAPVMSCAVLSTPLVNTQASPSACRGKGREEIPTHVPGGSNITLSRPGGHPRGRPQLLTLAQGSLVGGGSQALVTLPSPQGAQIRVQSLQGCKTQMQPISCFWEKGLKAPVVVKCSPYLLPTGEREPGGNGEGRRDGGKAGRAACLFATLRKGP